MTVLRRLGTIATIACLLAWFLLFRPAQLGGTASNIVVSGSSMEPTLYDGDFVMVRKQQTYEVGDIITYRVPNGDLGAGSLVIHRVTEVSEDGYVTQGDNRDEADDWLPTDEDVLGELWFAVPGAGQALATLRDPAMAAAVSGGLVVVLLLLEKPREKRRTIRQPRNVRARSERGPVPTGRR